MKAPGIIKAFIFMLVVFRLTGAAAASTDEQLTSSGSSRAAVYDSPAEEELTKAPEQPARMNKFISRTKELPPSSQPDAVETKAAEEKPRKVVRPGDNANPGIPVQPLFNSSSRRLTLIDETYLDAHVILREGNTCSQFFGGPRIATSVLNFLRQRLKKQSLEDSHIAIIMVGPVTTGMDYQTGLKYRLFKEALVNQMGPFYQTVNQESKGFFHKIGHYQANTREARVTMLLHELGHLVAGSDGRWLLPDDEGKRSQVDANTNTIMDRCSEQIGLLNQQRFEK
jgi:hypothetical protein